MSKIHDTIKTRKLFTFHANLIQIVCTSVHRNFPSFRENFIRVRTTTTRERSIKKRSFRVDELRRNIWSIKWDGNWINCENAWRFSHTNAHFIVARSWEDGWCLISFQPLSSFYCGMGKILVVIFLAHTRTRWRWCETWQNETWNIFNFRCEEENMATIFRLSSCTCSYISSVTEWKLHFSQLR